MIDAAPSYSAVHLVLQGIGAASTATVSRLDYGIATYPPCEDESADLGQSDDASRCGRGGSTFMSALQGGWEAELQKLVILRHGWNGYDAPGPTTAAIETARRYLQVAVCEGFGPKRVEPSVMGGVGITHRQGNRKVYLEFYNNGTGHSLFSDRSGKMQTMPVTPTAADFRLFIATAKDYLNGRDSSRHDDT